MTNGNFDSIRHAYEIQMEIKIPTKKNGKDKEAKEVKKVYY